MGDWLQFFWNRIPKILLKNKEYVYWRHLKSHVTLNIKSVIHAVNTDIMVIPGGGEHSYTL
jgi:hypothetical protein